VPRFIAGLERIGAAPTRVPAYLTTPALPGPAGLEACAHERAALEGGHISAIVFSSTAEVGGGGTASGVLGPGARCPAARRLPWFVVLRGAVSVPHAAGACRSSPLLRRRTRHLCLRAWLTDPCRERHEQRPKRARRQAQGLCRLMGGAEALASAVRRHGVVLAAHGPYTAAGAAEVLGLPVPVVSKRYAHRGACSVLCTFAPYAVVFCAREPHAPRAPTRPSRTQLLDVRGRCCGAGGVHARPRSPSGCVWLTRSTVSHCAGPAALAQHTLGACAPHATLWAPFFVLQSMPSAHASQP
jgi:hypothetical protein